MPTNGDDHDLALSESASSRLRRLAGIQRSFATHLEQAAALVDSLEGEPRSRLIRAISEEAGELGDSYHDLRRGLARLQNQGD